MATSLLTVRRLAGGAALADDLADRAAASWLASIERRRAELAELVAARHRRSVEVAFALEPDLKDGRGGLRDVHAMDWAAGAERKPRPASIDAAYTTLLAARVELHRCESGSGNTLLLQEQDAVAGALGIATADDLMRGIAGAGREIADASDEYWFEQTHRPARRGVGVLGRRRPGAAPLGHGLAALDGRLVLDTTPDPDDALLPLRAGLAAAIGSLRFHPDTVAAIAAAPPLDEPWPDDARDLFVQLLATGSIEAIEALDRAGAWERLLPEWAANRNRPQRNAYHRFTVDRHLLEAVRNAADRAHEVARPDLLLVGTLLHDIGKGHPGDHTLVGMELARTIAARMGFDRLDTETIVVMVEHHLLLPDVATRRDLDDPATITAVARQVGSIQRLELLGALTVADSMATGPAAWSGWKEQLVRDLVIRTAHVVLGGALGDVTTRAEPSPEARELLDDARTLGGPLFRRVDDRIVIACPDQPGLFSRIAGVLALHGLDVLEASVHSEGTDALDEFRVASRFDSEIRLERIRDDLERALQGRLALPARLAAKARSYPRRAVSARSMGPDVRVLNDASGDASVIEVMGPDSLGVLYRLTAALTDLQLDIRSAKVTTIGADAIDAFYVTDRHGGKVAEDQIGEIRAALLHALADPG